MSISEPMYAGLEASEGDLEQQAAAAVLRYSSQSVPTPCVVAGKGSADGRIRNSTGSPMLRGGRRKVDFAFFEVEREFSLRVISALPASRATNASRGAVHDQTSA